MGSGDFSDRHSKLQDFFQKAREMVVASAVASPAGASETLQKEVAELEARARDSQYFSADPCQAEQAKDQG
ncbi:hypothetical protein LIER_21733 [Lithospermum erythrorhizon]|uniref:Uncharacterized protein n=1 Tax=Lithospermum erythrorhizon TaxID=34254 RepID=A0AAV3QSB2_LITER